MHTTGRYIAAVVILVGGFVVPLGAEAVDRCKAEVDSEDGAIRVRAADITVYKKLTQLQ